MKLSAANQFVARERGREEKKLKAQKETEEKRKRKAESKPTTRKGRGRGRGCGKQGDEELSNEEAEQEAEAEGQDGRKKNKQKVPRTRGQFDSSDPPVIANGPGFAANFKPEPTIKMRDFVKRILANEPAILRCKKGAVKKVLSFSLKNAVAKEPDTVTFINGTSKAYAVKQTEMKSQVKKFSEKIRKNSTIAQDDTTPSLLGFDVILNAALGLPDDVFQDMSAAEGKQVPWLMKYLQNVMTLGCKQQQIRINDFFLLLKNSEAKD